ncbi:MAG: fused MFS/spermidine synthase, partial [Candidatus Eisenbacteria bacterium]
MTLRRRNFAFTLLLYVAFFASGASSLIAEVTWNRMLIVVVGNSLSATALILIVFMGGLGLGSYVGGKLLSGRRVSLFPYAVLEALIGVYVLLSPTIFGVLTDLFRSLAVGNADQTGLTVARVLVSMLALLLPASLMGATFPAIVNGAALETPSGRAARTGYLYSTNTLGAAVGCFAAGYHLLFEFGVQTALVVAFVSYLVAAGAGLVAGLMQRGEFGDATTSGGDRDDGTSGSRAALGSEAPALAGAATDPAQVR